MPEKGKVELVFVGGKRAPAAPYKVGEVYELPPRYARFPWFKLKSKADAVKVPALPQPKPAPLQPEKTEDEKAEDAFAEHLAEAGLLMAKPKPLVAEAEAPLEAAEAMSRSQLERMTKEELVKYIMDRGGTADMSLLKATLVEAALAL